MTKQQLIKKRVEELEREIEEALKNSKNNILVLSKEAHEYYLRFKGEK